MIMKWTFPYIQQFYTDYFHVLAMASLGKNLYYSPISPLRMYRRVPENPAARTQSHVSGKYSHIAWQQGCGTCENGSSHAKCLKEREKGRGIRYSVKYLNEEVIKLKDSAIIPRADQRHSRADGAWLIDLQCTGWFKGLCVTVEKTENACQTSWNGVANWFYCLLKPDLSESRQEKKN